MLFSENIHRLELSQEKKQVLSAHTADNACPDRRELGFTASNHAKRWAAAQHNDAARLYCAPPGFTARLYYVAPQVDAAVSPCLYLRSCLSSIHARIAHGPHDDVSYPAAFTDCAFANAGITHGLDEVAARATGPLATGTNAGITHGLDEVAARAACPLTPA